MRTICIIAVLAGIGLSCGAQQSTLVKVEKLTEAQSKSLADAQAKLVAAQVELDGVKAKIALEHGMVSQSYMEHSSWFQIDGAWILYRTMNAMTITGGTSTHASPTCAKDLNGFITCAIGAEEKP